MSLVSHYTLCVGTVGYKVIALLYSIWVPKCLNAFTVVLIFPGLLIRPLVIDIHLYARFEIC
uniref:Uncharacterized protein n=1 Tax=Arundo donax TaxID=35708 RepID=A0A0A9BS73_ARUDO